MNSSRRIDVYNQTIGSMFEFMKSTERLDDLYAKSIAIRQGRAVLAPVSELHAEQAPLIEKLARWRRENSEAYPSRFPVTMEGTKTWLRKQVLDQPSRILFLVMDENNEAIGHLGFANCLNDACSMEIDNVVRGTKDSAKGLMSESMEALIDWAEELFSPTEIYLRVLEENEGAIKFYERLGFIHGERIPLRRHEEGESVTFTPLEKGDPEAPDSHFARMVHAPDRRVDEDRMILTAGPSISARECSYALDATRSGWNTRWNVYLKRFEEEFASYVGVDHAIATSCCTGALHLALLALGIGPGDEVVVPDLTWVATGNVVQYVGATPVFADVQADSWCLDPDSFEASITARTKAVIPVHLYGHPAQMDRILAVAQSHGLKVIEDAAASIGAEFEGTRTGTFGDAAAFSFQGAKLTVTGEGGMLVMKDEALYRKALKLWDQGRVPGTFWIDETGWKYKMSNVQAAIGLGQLERNDSLIQAKRRIFSWYEEELGDVPCIRLNRELRWALSIYWMTSLRLLEGAPIARDDLAAALKTRNIDTRPVFPAISKYPIWNKKQQAQPTASAISETSMNLPSGVCLKRHEVAHVARTIRSLLGAD